MKVGSFDCCLEYSYYNHYVDKLTIILVIENYSSEIVTIIIIEQLLQRGL